MSVLLNLSVLVCVRKKKMCAFCEFCVLERERELYMCARERHVFERVVCVCLCVCVTLNFL